MPGLPPGYGQESSPEQGQNNPPAVTQAEAEAGILASLRSWSPLRVAQAIAALGRTASSIAWGAITGKPNFASVATSGAYGDLAGRPALGSAARLDAGTAAGNVPLLGAGGDIPDEVIPAGIARDTEVAHSAAQTTSTLRGGVGATRDTLAKLSGAIDAVAAGAADFSGDRGEVILFDDITSNISEGSHEIATPIETNPRRTDYPTVGDPPIMVTAADRTAKTFTMKAGLYDLVPFGLGRPNSNSGIVRFEVWGTISDGQGGTVTALIGLSGTSLLATQSTDEVFAPKGILRVYEDDTVCQLRVVAERRGIQVRSGAATFTYPNWGLGIIRQGGAPAVRVLDEAAEVEDLLKTLKFTGAGVTASKDADGNVVVNIPGGSAPAPGSHNRFIGWAATANPSQSELNALSSATSDSLVIPGTANPPDGATRYLVIGQPAAQDDLTSIVLSNGGGQNWITSFTKASATSEISGETVEYWVSNNALLLSVYGDSDTPVTATIGRS